MSSNRFFKFQFFFVFFLSSCSFEGGRSGGLSSQIALSVVAQFSDSILRTASGKPYIRLHGGPRICRFRPFYQDIVREQLSSSGVSDEILNDYLFGGERTTGGEEGTEGEETEGEDSSNEERASDRPIFHVVGNNWIELGLVIQNPTDFVLIINKVNLRGVGQCGEKSFTYSSEISSGYCAGGDFPILYIIPPGQQIDYQPENTNPFHNLKLYFDGFEIEDRRDQPSRSFQNQVNRGSGQGGTQGSNPATNELGAETCDPQREDYVIPSYQLELSLEGYFIGLSKTEYATVGFFRRVNFSTEVVY